VSLLWLGLDYLLNTGTALAQAGWWRDRLSAGVAAGLVGAAAWLGAWAILQRAAAADPARERTADARRRLLGFVTIAGALFAIGFLVAVLWLRLRARPGASAVPTGLVRAVQGL